MQHSVRRRPVVHRWSVLVCARPNIVRERMYGYGFGPGELRNLRDELRCRDLYKWDLRRTHRHRRCGGRRNRDGGR